MAKLAFVLCLIFAAVYCDVIRDPDVTIRQIMDTVGDEFLDVIVKGMEADVDAETECEEPVESNIEFLLHTQGQPPNPVRLDLKSLAKVDPKKKVIVLIHGWVSGSFGYGFPKLIEAYLRRYDANVIMVDWSQYAWRAYPVSVCLLPKVAKIVGHLLCTLSKQNNIDLSTMHVVGHSLGGQMSGFIGQHLQETCEASLGRITALDPAGPLFQNRDESQRVDSSDASFVDVMHTNQLELGFYDDCGHVDFYVNCGTLQPGCPTDLPDLEKIPDLSLTYVSCEHIRALDYMAESVSSKRFKATSCLSCPSICTPDLMFELHTSMGEDCDADARGSFHLTTNSKAPFAKGDDE